MRTTILAATATLLIGGSPLSAQIGPGPDNPAAPRSATETRSGDTSFSWLGIFGVFGLLGLVGARSRASSREHDFAGGRSTATSPTRQG